MFKIEAELPESIEVAVGDTGLSTKVPVKEIMQANPEMVRFAVLAGIMGALNNISRGKDENDKARTDKQWAAARDAKVKVWLGGTWGSTGRADSAMKLAKDQFIFEAMARTGAAASAIEARIKATVAEAFGKETPATFDAYLDAVVLAKHRDDDDARKAYRAKVEADLIERARERKAEANVELDLSDIL